MEDNSFFRENEESCIQNFVLNALRAKETAMELKRSLFERCILDDGTTLADLSSSKFSKFMSALFLSISLKLPTTLSESNYGLGIFTDLEVFHNFGTEKARKVFMKENPAKFHGVSAQQVQDLAVNSTKLRRWAYNQRTALIHHWDLPEGAVKPKVERVSKSTKERIQEEAASKMEEATAKRTREQLHQLVGNMVADAEKVNEPEDEETRKCREAVEAADKAEKKAKTETAILSGDTVANMNILPTFTLAVLIERLPRLAEDGLFVRIDVAEKLLYVENVENESSTFDFSNDYVI